LSAAARRQRFWTGRIAGTMRAGRTVHKSAGGQVTGFDLVPGNWVRHPQRPDWGRGQIQSVTGARITVNFEHAGKLLIDSRNVLLEPFDPDTDR
jgi:hypothetical protein